jgi:hypothetical protein
LNVRQLDHAYRSHSKREKQVEFEIFSIFSFNTKMRWVNN